MVELSEGQTPESRRDPAGLDVFAAIPQDKTLMRPTRGGLHIESKTRGIATVRRVGAKPTPWRALVLSCSRLSLPTPPSPQNPNQVPMRCWISHCGETLDRTGARRRTIL